ncbi:zinc-finger domain of monoamine-oxidase A repressor R1-domain-containing protein [Blyttiomyces helicus]|uniref:Zinc-finger domain of monoamine-oxidase A repressor R1-domain-containing protein n=1 Tax=Blyttiomyces helicus TaxID=388810 RepID=A0A4P9W8P1_9FUNG|nr:zinc-finger domain of monoamine-oxidase A repressor R1-domain-containing protein [Blyttiomyces helicus]|eukprot:RKO88899.1 zinc-finger domain of monoamine-oxidase A repressor R1-domain-containing protein [Blyttiomyces helicus]
MDFKIQCAVVRSGGGRCPVFFCQSCLLNRYGQNANEISKTEEANTWECPRCRDICNCSICRKKRGLAATGQLVHHAKAKGFTDAAGLLAVDQSPQVESTRPKKAESSKKETKKNKKEDGAEPSPSKEKPVKPVKKKKISTTAALPSDMALASASLSLSSEPEPAPAPAPAPASPPPPKVDPPTATVPETTFALSHFSTWLAIQQYLHRFAPILDLPPATVTAFDSGDLSSRLCTTLANRMLRLIVDDATCPIKEIANLNARELSIKQTWKHASAIYAIELGPRASDDAMLMDIRFATHSGEELSEEAKLVLLNSMVEASLNTDVFRNAVDEGREEAIRIRRDHRAFVTELRKSQAERKKQLHDMIEAHKLSNTENTAPPPSVDIEKLRREVNSEAMMTAEKIKVLTVHMKEKVANLEPRVASLGIDKKGNEYWSFPHHGGVYARGKTWWTDPVPKEDSWLLFPDEALPRLIGFLKYSGEAGSELILALQGLRTPGQDQ